MTSSVFNLSDLDGSNGFILNGINVNDRLGVSVSRAGDINGDDIDDLIVGSLGGTSSAGQSYVVFGSEEGFPASLELSDLDGSNGFALNGINPVDQSGTSVSGAGDVNGDGFDDLIVGASTADPNGIDGAGQSYVVFGSDAVSPASLEFSDLDGSNGFILNGINPIDFSGGSVSGAGDVNGDGIDDLIIGAVSPPMNQSIGQSYVVFGSEEGFPARLELSDLDGSNGFILNGIDELDELGGSVSGAGDVNGDGIDDLIIGASGADPNGPLSGQSYVVFGSEEGFPASLDISDLDGSNGFALNGINAGDNLGFSVSGAGDVNDDGFDDLIVGAPSADPNGPLSGQSYVVFGSEEGFPASLELSDLNGSNGIALNGINPVDRSGESVRRAGDFNGDGFDDVIVGASGADPNGQYSGQSYLVFGSDSGFPNSLELSDLDDTRGFALNGINAYDGAGRSVSGAGDINGDGFDDLIIGASGADPNGLSSGQSYVVFGFSNAVNILTVDTLVDENDGDLSPGDVSLREALSFTSEGGTINFAPELSGTIVLDPDLGSLVVDDSITVDGPGADTITVSGNDQVRVFVLASGEINDLTISNGNAEGPGGRDGSGGGILVPTGGSSFDDFVTLRNVIISDNSARFGGGLYNDEGFVEVINSSFRNNNAIGGGGIVNEGGEGGGTLIINDSNFENNTAERSGGGIDVCRGDVTLNNSSVAFNTAGDSGGGIIAWLGDVTVNNSFISSNSAEGGNGGGISIIESNLKVNDSEVGANSALNGDGGGIFSQDSNLLVSNSAVSNNDASRGGGGGIFSRNGSVAVNDSTLNKNIAGSDGGGIFSVDDNLVVSNSTVSNSFTSEPGSDSSGISSRGGSLVVNNSTVSGNGTGINVATQEGQTSIITNSTISNNKTGGGILNSSGMLQIRNSTITDNRSSEEGSGVASFGNINTRTEVVSSIISGNAKNDDVAFIFGNDNSFVSQGNNLIGNGNATDAFVESSDLIIGNADPGLDVLDDNGGPTQTHNLQAGSPAIDAGSNPDNLITDQRGDGFERVVNGQADIGALEVQLEVDLDIGLYDADSDSLITNVEDGDQISESALAGRNVTIAAFVSEDSPFSGLVESMRLNLNNGEVRRTENIEPYALFGDRNGDFNGGALSSGENTISFDIYSEDNLRGDFLGTITRSFSILKDLDIGLYDADSDELLSPLQEGDELLASNLAGRNVTIAAFVPEDSPFSGLVESMRLNLNNGELLRTENIEPYALFGDINGDYNGGALPVGNNTIAFELYPNNNLRGGLIDTITRNFTVINDLSLKNET